MPELDVSETFTNGAANDGAEVKAAFNTIETFVNTTGLDEDNLQYFFTDVYIGPICITGDMVSSTTLIAVKPRIDQGVLTPVRATLYFDVETAGSAELELYVHKNAATNPVVGTNILSGGALDATVARTVYTVDSFSDTFASDDVITFEIKETNGGTATDISITLQCKVKHRS